MSNSQSPERRSAADLQRILDSMIGQSGFVLAGALPDVLSAYENENDLIILDPSEYEGLRVLCEAHAEMELGPAELFQFLSMIQKPQDIRPPTPPNSSSADLTSSTHTTAQAYDQSTPNQRPRRKRHSDRIRSPSDSSSSSSEDDIDEAARRRQDRHSSEPASGKPFPAMPTDNAGLGNRPLPPRRKKTLSDSSRLDSPLAAKVQRNGTAPPSAFGSFARPSPASRRRRGSSGAYASDQDESYIQEHSSGRFGRSVSQQSATSGIKSPTWSNRSDSVPPSPISPGVDQTSFHVRAKSPEDLGEEEARATEDVIEDRGEGSVHDGDHDLEELDDVVGQAMLGTEALNPRLSRISTESTTSLRTSHDKLQALQKQNGELTRKLKESERQLSLLGADNDRMVVDLERQLEEARHELAQKRKEDKELRGHELKQNIQISGLEADLANVQRTLEQSKEHRANMQKMYDSQCDEAQRLRDLLRDRDEEIHNLEESLQEHEADEEKYTREIESLEAEIKRLESELVVARRAESVLETQKQENLQLKETIDRMRFDLDEARATAAAKGSHGRSSTNTSSAGGTLSRNLGDEINRRLLDAEILEEQDIQEEEAEQDEDGIVETIVTKQRIRRVGGRKVATSNGEESGVPVLRIEESIAEYADAGTLTDPVEVLPIAGPSSPASLEGAQDTPPAYTAQPDPINEQEVLDRAHPRKASFDVDMVDEYDVVVKATGVRCSVLEEAITRKKAEKAKKGLMRRSSFFSRPERPDAGVLDTIVYVTSDALAGKFSAYIVGAFALGLVAGSHFWSGPAGIHPRDLQLWSSFNDLAASSGAGEGFLPAGAMGLAGLVGAGAHGVGRVPT